MTKLLKIHKRSEMHKLYIAAEVIKNGGIVAFPTETVYGLGANALDKKAIDRIFKVKKRAKNDPIIVHVASINQCKKICYFNVIAKKLAEKFWPGPLTLVLKKKKCVPENVTAGLQTIAVRMPSNEIALNLIKLSNVPIGAPSANLFGKPSATTAKHVIEDFYGKIDIIIDSGKTRIGVESTVVDARKKPLTILRPGGLTKERIKKVIGDVILHDSVLEMGETEILSPGMYKRHYAPKAKMIVVEGKKERVIKKIKELQKKFESKKIGIIAFRKGCYKGNVKVLGTNTKEVARNLFEVLREFDKENVDIIISECYHTRGLGLAITNRLKRASGFNIIKV